MRSTEGEPTIGGEPGLSTLPRGQHAMQRVSNACVRALACARGGRASGHGKGSGGGYDDGKCTTWTTATTLSVFLSLSFLPLRRGTGPPDALLIIAACSHARAMPHGPALLIGRVAIMVHAAKVLVMLYCNVHVVCCALQAMRRVTLRAACCNAPHYLLLFGGLLLLDAVPLSDADPTSNTSA